MGNNDRPTAREVHVTTEEPRPQPLTKLVSDALLRTTSLRALWRMSVDTSTTPPARIGLRQLHTLSTGGGIQCTDEVVRALTAGFRAAGLDIDVDTVAKAADVQFPPLRTIVSRDPAPGVYITMALPAEATDEELAEAQAELEIALAQIEELRRAAIESRDARRRN